MRFWTGFFLLTLCLILNTSASLEIETFSPENSTEICGAKFVSQDWYVDVSDVFAESCVLYHIYTVRPDGPCSSRNLDFKAKRALFKFYKSLFARMGLFRDGLDDAFRLATPVYSLAPVDYYVIALRRILR